MLVLFALALCLVAVSGNTESLFVASEPFDPSSLQKALHVQFTDAGYQVSGRGVSNMDVDFNPGVTGESGWADGGLHFGDHQAGFFSVKNVDLRDNDGLFRLPGEETGLLVKFTLNFGDYDRVCERCQSSGGGARASTCFGTGANEYWVPDTDGGDGPSQILFSIPAAGFPQNLQLDLQRQTNSRSVIDDNCDLDEELYRFQLTVGGSVVAWWRVYGYHGLWLEDGEDHTFLITIPRATEWGDSDSSATTGVTTNPWPLLYIDGMYVCADYLSYADDGVESDYIVLCEDVDNNLSSDGWLPQQFTNSECRLTRLFLGNAPSEWWATQDWGNWASIPVYFNPDTALRSVTFKDFQIWNYRGVPTPSDPELCTPENADQCFYYRRNPWCRNANGSWMEYLQFGLTLNNSAACFDEIDCTDLSVQEHCNFWGDNCTALGQYFSCCQSECVELGSDKFCSSCSNSCSAGQTCCDRICRDIFNDREHCYSCGNSCPNTTGSPGALCCNGYRGCTATDRLCGNDCGTAQDCLDISSNHKCCLTGGNPSCVELSGTNVNHCGECGNNCDDRDIPERDIDYTCCTGACVQIGTNEHCGGCDDTCRNSTADKPIACCDFGCVELDTDLHCGYCGHDCLVLGQAAGKELHCCDGLCVEWGHNETSCGCPATDCLQQFGSDHVCCDNSVDRPVCTTLDTEEFCGACFATCLVGETCCDDGAGGKVCRDLDNDLSNCGQCGRVCPVGLDDACCAGTCVEFGLDQSCNSCNACTDPFNNCCADVFNGTTYTCRDPLVDVEYCGDMCTNCTEILVGAVQPWCCAGSCHDIVNTQDDCNCGDDCDDSARCCGSGILADCTPLGTDSDCTDCGDSCPGTSNQCCIIDDLANPLTNATDRWQCKDVLNDVMHCGKCGRQCGIDELCCDGQCQSIAEHDRCGACDISCSTSELCCNESGSYTCSVYNAADDNCGCPLASTNCTAIVPPPENHDQTYYCCRGACAPNWFDCTD